VSNQILKVLFRAIVLSSVSPKYYTTHLKLFSKLRGVGLRIHTQHVLIGEHKLTDGDGGLSAQTGLQYGIMNEYILLLKPHRKSQFRSDYDRKRIKK